MNNMKIVSSFRKKSPTDVRNLWVKLNTLKSNLEKKLNTTLTIEIDPINEKFYIMPIDESFYFSSPVSYSLHHHIEGMNLVQ